MRYHPIHLFLSVITKSNSAENRAVLLLLENPLHTDLQPFQVAVHDKPSFSQAEILASVACIAVADVQVASAHEQQPVKTVADKKTAQHHV